MRKRDTTHGERIRMIQMKEQGQSIAEIARQMGLHPDTVRHWWRAYRDGGWAALVPQKAQRPRRGLLSSFDPLVRYVALRVKCKHPHWGPDRVLLAMEQHASLCDKRLPGRSALAAYLKPYLPRIRGRSQRTVLRRPFNPKVRAKSPHECWEMDFKGDEALGYGSSAPFVIVDAFTSASLMTKLFPSGLKGITVRDVQNALRDAFVEWGLPEYIRMDRASIFVGSTRLEWPGPLLLWLVGLGVQPIINDAGRPTQNPHVERY